MLQSKIIGYPAGWKGVGHLAEAIADVLGERPTRLARTALPHRPRPAMALVDGVT